MPVPQTVGTSWWRQSPGWCFIGHNRASKNKKAEGDVSSSTANGQEHKSTQD